MSDETYDHAELMQLTKDMLSVYDTGCEDDECDRCETVPEESAGYRQLAALFHEAFEFQGVDLESASKVFNILNAIVVMEGQDRGATHLEIRGLEHLLLTLAVASHDAAMLQAELSL